MNQKFITSHGQILCFDPFCVLSPQVLPIPPNILHARNIFLLRVHDHTLSRKKLSENHHIVELVIQCKQAAYASILTKVGNDRHVDVRAWPRPSRGAWAETLQMNGFI